MYQIRIRFVLDMNFLHQCSYINLFYLHSIMEDQSEIERKQKQMYLKTEIVDGGYDVDMFVEYMDNIRENGGTDVDVWTMPELQENVLKFKAQYIPPDGDAHFQQQQQQEEYQDQEYEEEQKVEKSQSKFMGLPETDVLRDKEDVLSLDLGVRISETNELSSSNQIAITIVEPELVKGGIFTASYILYKIKTAPFDWEVKRRYSDFNWLRSILVKIHPGFVIPPIPQKKSKGKFENDFIKKRMYFLERFLNALLRIPEIKSNRFFLAFLNVTNENQLKNIKKEGDNHKGVQKLEELSTISGQIHIEINTDLKIFNANAHELFTSTDPIYAKVRKLSKQLIFDFDQVSNTIFSLGECFAALYNATTLFNKNVTSGRSEQLEDIYLTLNNMMVSWGEQMLGQIKIVQKNLGYFFKYAYYENESFKEAVGTRSRLGLDYVKRKKELLAKKEKTFIQGGDSSKWDLNQAKVREYGVNEVMKNKQLAMDLMFNKETQAILEARNWFAYHNAQAFQEICRGMQEKCKRYVANFYELAKAQSDNLTEVHVQWADVMAHFTESKSMKEVKQVVRARDSSNTDDYQLDGAGDA